MIHLRDRNSDYDKTPPVKEGDVLENLECIAIGKKNDGIFKHKGFVIIVPNTEKGEKYNLKITRVLHQVSFAEVIGGET